jgi:butyrate kinase
MNKILVINPGSTSTKVALFLDLSKQFEHVIRHDACELAKYECIYDQYNWRKMMILEQLKSEKLDMKTLSAVVARGGAVRPMKSGTYRINDQFKEDCRSGYSGQHASNLGAILADEIAAELGIDSFVVDPPTVDEMQAVARITGLPDMHRKSRFHALNQKASARKAANTLGKEYVETRLIVAHLGGGISVGAHMSGRVVDVNDCYDSEGPLMPERAGTLPVGQVVDMCFSGRYNRKQIEHKLVGQGGLVAHLGTNNLEDVVRRIEAGDIGAELVYKAMAYQCAKHIAASAAVLKGRTDAIVITGGMAYDNRLVTLISERVEWIAPLLIYPGDNEMEAMAHGAYRVLTGEEEAKNYDEHNYFE